MGEMNRSKVCLNVVMFCFRDVLKANLKIFHGLATAFNRSLKARKGAETF